MKKKTVYSVQGTEYSIQVRDFSTQIIEQTLKNVNHGTGNKSCFKSRSSFLVCLLSTIYCLLVFGCATPASKLPAPPPKYVQSLSVVEKNVSANSLWVDRGNIFEDLKAKRINDLVTINVVENLSGSGTADTDTKRDSSLELDVDEFLGMNLDFGLQDVDVLENFYEGGNVFKPTINATSKSDFKGEGDTNREGTLVATITAKVVEVMPNGNLMLEARKELTINNERQILVLLGMARPYDITDDNTISSQKIADARVYYVGDGVIQEKQSPGWMTRALDHVWPF